jgi:ubiquitin thioesterase OTU1
MALRTGGGAPRATRRYRRAPTDEEEEDLDDSGAVTSESGTDPVPAPPPPPPPPAPAPVPPRARPAPTTRPPAVAAAAPKKKKTKEQQQQQQLITLAAAGGGTLVIAAAALLLALSRRRRKSNDDGGGKEAAAASAAAATTKPKPIALPKATPDFAAIAPGAFPGDDAKGQKGLARVVRERVAADNSCLFHAVGFCMHRSTGRAPFLRRVVAREVASDPHNRYTEAFLGMPNSDYCDWILQPQHWGGGIELAVLSAHYRREIAAWNVRTGACHVFGEEQGLQRRCMVVYDGSHYDALVIRPPAGWKNDAGGKSAGGETTIGEFNPRTRRGRLVAEAAARLVDAERKRLGLGPAAMAALMKAREEEDRGGAAKKKGGKKKKAVGENGAASAAVVAAGGATG